MWTHEYTDYYSNPMLPIQWVIEWLWLIMVPDDMPWQIYQRESDRPGHHYSTWGRKLFDELCVKYWHWIFKVIRTHFYCLYTMTLMSFRHDWQELYELFLCCGLAYWSVIYVNTLPETINCIVLQTANTVKGKWDEVLIPISTISWKSWM